MVVLGKGAISYERGTPVPVGAARHPTLAGHASPTMYELNGFRKLTPPQNHPLLVSTGTSKQCVDDLVWELTF